MEDEILNSILNSPVVSPICHSDVTMGVKREHSNLGDGTLSGIFRWRTMEIVIRKLEDDWIHVSGREFGDPQFWAIEFMDWAEWMGCTYVAEGVELTDAQIVAECLNEMTWAGWSVKEASESSESLMSSLDEALNEVNDELSEANEIDLHKKRSE